MFTHAALMVDLKPTFVSNGARSVMTKTKTTTKTKR